MVLLARDVAKKIEAELEYPGQIKINVIRETQDENIFIFDSGNFFTIRQHHCNIGNIFS